MQGLVRDLGRLTIFMICAQAVIYFRPREQYEKYLRFIMNLLILLQFLIPVRNLFGGNVDPESWWRGRGFEASMERIAEFDLDAWGGEDGS